jgi:serine/threonine protein kinase
VRNGVLTPAVARLVEGLVEEVLSLNEGDVEATLHSLPPRVQAGLSSLSATVRRGGTASEDSFDGLESTENVSTEAQGRYCEGVGPDGRPVELGRVIGQLEHPAVVPVYELVRRRDGTLYFTMQRLKGRTLAQAVADAGSLESRLALVHELLTIYRAIAAAHHRGVIHRDLKPQHVMLGAHGETFVMDWGLARVLGRRESSERPISLAPDLTNGTDAGPVGTPASLSPEQAWGEREQFDARSDVWGLRALLFEALCARAPVVVPSPWEVLAEVHSKSLPKGASLGPDAPPSWQRSAFGRSNGRRRTATKPPRRWRRFWRHGSSASG